MRNWWNCAGSLHITKKYDLNSNVPVFLFHCANRVGDDFFKNFKNHWLPYCNYGSFLENLQYGHIFLIPRLGMKELCVDNLIRWFLMIFQESKQPVCPNCGVRLLKDTPKPFSAEYKCPNCNFTSSVGRCRKCSRVLWRNKLYWSYNIYDAAKGQTICPDCAGTIWEPCSSVRGLACRDGEFWQAWTRKGTGWVKDLSKFFGSSRKSVESA